MGKKPHHPTSFSQLSEETFPGSKNCQGVSSLIGGIILHLFLGAQYSTGNISPYIVSFFRHRDKTITDRDAFLLLPSLVVVATLFFPLGGYLAKNYHPKLVIPVGGLLGCAMFIGAAFSEEFYVFFAFYIMGFGIACGTTYMSPIHSVWGYFPNRKGLCGGLIIGGFGFGAFIYNFISSWICNPDNEEPKPEVEGSKDKYYEYEKVGIHVPAMMMVLALCFSIHVLISMMLVFKKPRVDVEFISFHGPRGRQSSRITKAHTENNDFERNKAFD